MAETVKKRDYAPQFIGLGGTGCDILASIIRNRKLIMPILRQEGLKVTFLALDVANSQIDALLEAYNDLLEDLKQQNIPRDRIFLTAKSVKFSKPEAMFEFIRNYPDYVSKENIKFPNGFKPWLSSALDIPDLAGGVGRKRSLAKGIYLQNYYMLGSIREPLDGFMEHMVGSTVQPAIFIVWGLGGGSGSGIAMDFCRQVRRRVGRGTPIMGFCVAPCPGDDPPARGASAYASLMELNYQIEKSVNDNTIANYGEFYENPFSTFFMIPLGPADSQGRGLKYAHRIIDDAIGDMLVKGLNFDLTDLLGQVGYNVDMGKKWLHTICTIKVSYPVSEFMELTRSYLARMDKVRVLRKEKQEIFWGAKASDTGGLKRTLDICVRDLAEIYRKWLIQRNRYEPVKFEEDMKNLIYEDRAIETDFIVYLRGAQASIKGQLSDLYQSVRAIGMDAAEGTLEYRINRQLMEFYNIAIDLPTKFNEYYTKIPDMLENLPSDLMTTQALTPTQVLLVRDVIDLAEMVGQYMDQLKKWLECKKLSEHLIRFYESSEKSEEQSQILTTVRRIANPEIVVLFSLISSMFSPLQTELKNVDEYQTNLVKIRRILTLEEDEKRKICNLIDEQILTAGNEKRRLEKENRQIKFWTTPAKKQTLSRRLGDIKHNLEMLRVNLEESKDELDRVTGKIKEYSNIEKKFDVNSDYRRLLPEIGEMANKYYDKRNEMVRDRGFYDRTAELTEVEQLQIVQRILKDDEAALNRESILNEIVDRAHLRRYVVSVLNLFKSTETIGLTTDYKTEFLWFTVVAPPGIWNKELEQDVLTSLAGYVKQDVSRSIFIRQIESDEPWEIRFLLVAANAWPSALSMYPDIKQGYERVSKAERGLAHSYLLEQGILADGVNQIPPAAKS
ncbi:MAG: tubulin-like doman-containing protein [Dehalococcoidia bacterium]|nr:tubulin-like doman-containing protein [Dehalococcoidia bacterium]MDZ4246999.1 tubulin-like doman-containing protein [Dehalococcoidia bacterium]